MKHLALAALLPLALALPAGAAGSGHDHAHDHAGHDHAHDHAMHATGAAVSMGEERLALPDLPVTLAGGQTGGFRSLLPATAPIILSFTYTGCESLCDITNAILLGVDDRLGAAGPAEARIVTLTIDPATDTPERLAQARAELGASDRWLWMTGGERGTRALLDALRFPPGAVEDHDPVFLVGRPCAGQVTRIVGLADPDRLVALAAGLPECAG